MEADEEELDPRAPAAGANEEYEGFEGAAADDAAPDDDDDEEKDDAGTIDADAAEANAGATGAKRELFCGCWGSCCCWCCCCACGLCGFPCWPPNASESSSSSSCSVRS